MEEEQITLYRKNFFLTSECRRMSDKQELQQDGILGISSLQNVLEFNGDKFTRKEKNIKKNGKKNERRRRYSPPILNYLITIKSKL